ncbi:hypothetical protein [Saccharothrix deserti]|uniref:hypothetical protein n=1 Tax=Saccharothrix deserti TaxID=2593674 RepID=UPI00131AA880|nr:hypothetical protein [Saccharothrix deserti]
MTTKSVVVVSLTVVCATAGGLLGSRLRYLDTSQSVVLVAVSALLGFAVAIGLLTTERRSVPKAEPETEPETEREPETGTGAAPVSPPVFEHPTDDTSLSPVFVHPTPSPEPARSGNNRPWWTETPGRPAAVRTEQPAAATPLTSYDANRAVVAQCPHCGDFRLDVEQHGDAYAFHCRNPNCGHRWEWSAGAPWPTTVVRRNLTG